MKLPVITSIDKNYYVISIEGCNGAGKTTLLNRFSDDYPEFECMLCVPMIYQTAKDMKSFMLNDASALCSALYYLAGSVEVKFRHNPTYSKIMLDRSIWSTFAAAYAKDEKLIEELLNCLYAVQTNVFIPDVIIVLEASYEVSRERIGRKIDKGEFDQESKRQFDKKAEFYHILQETGYDVSFINTNELNKDEVYHKFCEIITSHNILI